MKSKEIKLAEIKKHNPTLHSKVMNGEMKLQQAYNEVMGDINSTTEYKGRGTKGQNKIVWNGLDKYGNEVSTGTYFVILVSDNKIQTRKVVFAK